MNKFKGLNNEQLLKVKQAGYIIDENKQYTKYDYEQCANTILDYIMSHSKNEIPKIQKMYNDILKKII